MSSNQSGFDVTVGSERSFGVVISAVFLIIGLYPLIEGGAVYLWALTISALLFLIAVFTPGVLRTPNRLWFKFGMALGAVVAPVVMGLIFFVTVVPIGLLLRLWGKDLLYQKLDRDAQSYWIKRDEPVRSMKDQF